MTKKFRSSETFRDTINLAYTAKSNRQGFKFTFETPAKKLRVWLKAQPDNDRQGKLYDKGYIELQNSNGNGHAYAAVQQC